MQAPLEEDENRLLAAIASLAEKFADEVKIGTFVIKEYRGGIKVLIYDSRSDYRHEIQNLSSWEGFPLVLKTKLAGIVRRGTLK